MKKGQKMVKNKLLATGTINNDENPVNKKQQKHIRSLRV